MKKDSKKRSLTNLVTALVLVCAMFLALPTTAFAATQLSSVGITFEANSNPSKAPKVTATNKNTTVKDVVWEKDYAKYKPGDVAKATVKLATKSGYFFKDDYTKSNIKVKNATLVSFSYEKGDLWIVVKYNVGEQLKAPKNLKWDTNNLGRACWDKVANAASYTVTVGYDKNVRKFTGITKLYYDFTDELLSEDYFGRDDIYFTVTAVPKSGTKYFASQQSKSKCFNKWEDLYWDNFDYDNWDDDYWYWDDDVSRPPVPGYAAEDNGWLYYQDSWYYYDGSGTYVRNDLKHINGKNYAFNSYGEMQTGWYQHNGEWYYFSPATGEMLTGWQRIDGFYYFFDFSSGKMYHSQWYYDNGTWYYFDPSGVMATGWRYLDGYWYYLDSNGAMVKGEVVIDGVKHYFAGNGTMQY